MDQAIDSSVKLVLQNFPILLYVLAILLSTIIVSARRQRRQKRHNINTFIAYIMLFAVGFSGIWGFILHVFFPVQAAANAGWNTSPYQFEVAMGDLAMGACGVFAFKASHGFRVATTLFVSIYLWGSAAGHAVQMILFNNFTPGNAGIVYVTDIIIPATLIVLVKLHKKYQNLVFS